MHKFGVMILFNYAKLEECIKKSGKTRTYLCSRLGRPAYYLRDVIRQRNAIPSEYQHILAEELGVTVEFLNDIEETKKDPAQSAESLLSAELSDLSDAELRDVLDFIRFKKSQRNQ